MVKKNHITGIVNGLNDHASVDAEVIHSTCVLGLVSVGGAVALGRTAAEVTTAAGPFPTVAMIWPWVLSSSCGVTVWTWRPWRGRVDVAAPPASEAGFTNSGRVPMTCKYCLS